LSPQPFPGLALVEVVVEVEVVVLVVVDVEVLVEVDVLVDVDVLVVVGVVVLVEVEVELVVEVEVELVVEVEVEPVVEVVEYSSATAELGPGAAAYPRPPIPRVANKNPQICIATIATRRLILRPPLTRRSLSIADRLPRVNRPHECPKATRPIATFGMCVAESR
jgi:hypothetical protein